MILTTILIYIAYTLNAPWWIYMLIALELLCRKVNLIVKEDKE